MHKSMDGQRVVLQVLDGNWCAAGGEDVPELKDLFLERAWLLAVSWHTMEGFRRCFCSDHCIIKFFKLHDSVKLII